MSTNDPLLKTRPVAEALGVSMSTVKRWVDSGALRASRTLGKHRLVPLSEAIRFARRQGLPVDKLEEMKCVGIVRPVRTIDDSVVEELTAALLGGNRARARVIVFSAFDSGMGAAVMADGLIRPVMERIGHEWTMGEVEVFQEHQATLILAGVLNGLNDRLARTVREGSPVALGATPEGDWYQLPLQLGQVVLQELGWDVRSLGSNLPMASLAGAVLSYRPKLVFLSVSYLADPERFEREYSSVFESATAVGAAVMVGGQALLPELRARLAYTGFGDRMTHLAEFAKRLAAVSPPEAEHPSGDIRLL